VTMLNPIRHRISEALDGLNPITAIVAIVALAAVLGLVIGYTVGCHVGYVRACDDGPSRPVKYFEVKK